MGVKGLWKILDPVARPVSSPEHLVGQKVAIDASIWIYQFLRVFPPSLTSSGSTYSPLVLAGLFQRICKLLYFDILPVMIFDGIPPTVKQRTTRDRAERRGKAEERHRRLARKLVAAQLHLNVLKNKKPEGADDEKSFVKQSLDTFEALDQTVAITSTEPPSINDEEREVDEEYLAHVDTTTAEFSRFPINIQQEILLAKREYLFRQHIGSVRDDRHHLGSLDFSNRQVEALVKRRKLAAQLEQVNEEGSGLIDYEGGYQSLNHSGLTKVHARRIVSEANRSYVLVKGQDGGWVMGASSSQEESINEKKEANTTGTTVSPTENDDFDTLFGGTAMEAGSSKSAKKPDFLLQKLVEPLRQELPHVSLNNDFSFDVSGYFTTESPAVIEEQVTTSSLNIEKGHILEAKMASPVKIIQSDKKASQSPSNTVPIEIVRNDENGSHEEGDESEILNLTVEGKTLNPTVENKALSLTVKDKVSNPIIETLSSNSSAEDENEVAMLNECITEPSFLITEPNDEIIYKLQREMQLMRNDLTSSASASHSLTVDNELTEDFRCLLTIFGIPWIMAPGEAEAQCAWLQRNGFVDAVLSDDNDTLLFGATRVYRHFFNNERRISMYLARDLEQELGLTKDQLILLALLLGSDYNLGVRGVGPVKAKELLRFLQGCDLQQSLAIIRNGLVYDSWPKEWEARDVDAKLLHKLAIQCAMPENWHFDQDVIMSYLKPVIDEQSPTFRWKLLKDINSLYEFLQLKLKWTMEQSQKVVEPIIRRQIQAQKKKSTKQTNLDTFLYRT